ncbi:MAG: hypothetical protein ACI3XQ_06075 [Eubacteriales bacterium]
MKKNYNRILRMNNSVEPAAPARVWGKGVPGKFGKSTNFEIPEWMFTRELDEKNGISNE